jgi:hypothetical protein
MGISANEAKSLPVHYCTYFNHMGTLQISFCPYMARPPVVVLSCVVKSISEGILHVTGYGYGARTHGVPCLL